MNYYVISKNTHSNKGKVILAGPFITTNIAENTIEVNAYKWGVCLIERLCDDIAKQLLNK
jgi:hypothetical protein